jgi:hypothetical protein
MIGETPFHFELLRNARIVPNQLGRIQQINPRPALVCMNDDITAKGAPLMQMADKAIENWMQQQFPTPSWFERQ